MPGGSNAVSLLRFAIVPIVASLLLVAFSGAASAHSSQTTADGVYRVTWGFLDEPAYAGQKNRLDLIIRENATGVGVAGLTAEDLTVTLLYGEEEYDLGELRAYGGPKGASAGGGNYTSEHPVYLTRPGIYSLRVVGEIGDSSVDLTIPTGHAYAPMEEIMFPEPAATDPAAIEARLAALESEVAALRANQQTQSTMPTPLSPQSPTAPVPSMGLVGALAALGLALVLARRMR